VAHHRRSSLYLNHCNAQICAFHHEIHEKCFRICSTLQGPTGFSAGKAMGSKESNAIQKNYGLLFQSLSCNWKSTESASDATTANQPPPGDHKSTKPQSWHHPGRSRRSLTPGSRVGNLISKGGDMKVCLCRDTILPK